LGLYADRVLPWMIDRAMRADRLERLRAEIAGHARGRVLELGIGSGPNLPYYRRDLELVVGIDPSKALLARARPRAAWMTFDTRLIEAPAEAIPLEDAGFDCAVVTWSLCSMADPLRALGEVRRLLRPGGELVFVEHGLSDEARLARFQHRLTPLWRRIAGGCRLNRDMAALVRGAGFRLTELETGHLVAGPRAFTYHYKGRAVPA
jgi:ubiquinone/menaquinone biosynthesis C-methylase UbiE